MTALKAWFAALAASWQAFVTQLTDFDDPTLNHSIAKL